MRACISTTRSSGLHDCGRFAVFVLDEGGCIHMVHIVDPLWVQLQKPECQGGGPSLVVWARIRLHISIALGSLGPLNEDATMPYQRGCLEGDYPDSLLPLNTSSSLSLKTLGDMDVRHSWSVPQDHCIITDGRHHVFLILSQPNVTNCGYYMM